MLEKIKPRKIMNETKLKNCPFCGGEDVELKEECGGELADGPYFIECGCTARGAWGDLKEEAIKFWNTRAGESDD